MPPTAASLFDELRSVPLQSEEITECDESEQEDRDNSDEDVVDLFILLVGQLLRGGCRQLDRIRIDVCDRNARNGFLGRRGIGTFLVVRVIEDLHTAELDNIAVDEFLFGNRLVVYAGPVCGIIVPEDVCAAGTDKVAVMGRHGGILDANIPVFHPSDGVKIICKIELFPPELGRQYNQFRCPAHIGQLLDDGRRRPRRPPLQIFRLSSYLWKHTTNMEKFNTKKQGK